MKVLFVGDIYGNPGKLVASKCIPRFISEENVDFCIVNGENAAGGFGLTQNIAHKYFQYGVDIITSGNHIWDRREAYELLQKSDRILRPANYAPGVPGSGYTLYQKNGKIIGVINLLGRVFMQPVDCPFRVAQRIVEKLRQETQHIIVDFHAECTAEKIGMGYHLDGSVSAVVGTHTHVMTADERILPQGTAAITDVGMTGPHDSIIGVRIEESLSRLMTQMPVRFSPAEDDLRFSAVMLELDDSTGRALSISRIFEKFEKDDG